MATNPSALAGPARHDLDALANIRRVTFASKMGKPEAVEGNAEKDASIPVPATSGVDAQQLFRKFRTHIKVYMISTGDDPGDECELEGYIRFTYPPPDTRREIDIEMPVKKSWAGENGGLGRFISEYTHDSIGLPSNFRVFLAEDDLFGDDIIINWGIDWTPENLYMANGGAWKITSWNTGDTRFRATVWFRVSEL